MCRELIGWHQPSQLIWLKIHNTRMTLKNEQRFCYDTTTTGTQFKIESKQIQLFGKFSFLCYMAASSPLIYARCSYSPLITSFSQPSSSSSPCCSSSSTPNSICTPLSISGYLLPCSKLLHLLLFNLFFNCFNLWDIVIITISIRLNQVIVFNS